MNNLNDLERRVVRHKQQRLLLIHHASRCRHKSNCPVTHHCAYMKNLCRHLPFCKDSQCKVPHCRSSRCIWDHYKECNDSSCLTCGPVRETIRRCAEGEQQQQHQGIWRSIQPNHFAFDPHRIPDDREGCEPCRPVREIIGRSADRELIVPSFSTTLIEAETSSAEGDKDDSDSEDSDAEDDEEELEKQGMDSNEIKEQAAAAAHKQVVRGGERMEPPPNKRKGGLGDGGRSQKHRRR